MKKFVQKSMIAPGSTVNSGGSSGGINPTGTMSITANGKHNVKTYEYVDVNVAGGSGEFVGVKYSEFGVNNEYGFPRVADARSLNMELLDTTQALGYLFYGNSNSTTKNIHYYIEDFYLPDNLTKIYELMFYKCKSLKNVYTESWNQIEVIESSAFNYSGIETFDYNIPNLKEIKNSFGYSSLKTLVLRNPYLVTLTNSTALTGTLIQGNAGYIYVPASLVEEYKVATNWSAYSSRFRALEDYTVDGTITGALDVSKI